MLSRHHVTNQNYGGGELFQQMKKSSMMHQNNKFSAAANSQISSTKHFHDTAIPHASSNSQQMLNFWSPPQSHQLFNQHSRLQGSSRNPPRNNFNNSRLHYDNIDNRHSRGSKSSKTTKNFGTTIASSGDASNLILVEDTLAHQKKPFQATRRPRMGVANMGGMPAMTSTPTCPQEDKKKTGIGGEDQEPIYCEINSPIKKPPELPMSSHPTRQQQLNRRSDVTSSRPQPADFSRLKLTDHKPFTHDYAPIPVQQTSRTRPVTGLGRRAITQVDFNPRPSHKNTASRPLGQPIREFNVRKCSSRDLYIRPECDSEFSIHPDGSSSRPKFSDYFQHQKECYSDYGVNNDDTISTVTTTTTNTNTTSVNLANSTTIRRGLLWQQRDHKLFSRWKERFFILTTEYLQCFKKAQSQITEMGGFIFKIKLCEVEDVELVDKKGYLTINLSISKDNNGSKILLRKPEGIREWFQSIKECVDRSKERRGWMKSTKEFWSKKQFTDSSSMEQWVMARKRIEKKYAYSSETESCVSGSNLKVRSSKNSKHPNMVEGFKNPVTTTDYGFIDLPLSTATTTSALKASKTDLHSNFSQEEIDVESSSCTSPLPSELVMKKVVRDSSSTFSQDSGVDSMNTNSSGSGLSRQTPVFSTTTNAPRILNHETTPTKQPSRLVRGSQLTKSRIPTLSPKYNSTYGNQKPVKPKRSHNGGEMSHLV